MCCRLSIIFSYFMLCSQKFFFLRLHTFFLVVFSPYDSEENKRKKLRTLESDNFLYYLKLIPGTLSVFYLTHFFPQFSHPLHIICLAVIFLLCIFSLYSDLCLFFISTFYDVMNYSKDQPTQ